MVNPRSRVLIVSLPGVLQNVLKQSIQAGSVAELIGVANGGLSAMSMIKKEQPDLIIIDSNLPEAETRELMKQIKALTPHKRCLVIVETTQQQYKASLAGADFTLRAYDLPTKLERLLEDVSANNNKAIDKQTKGANYAG